jgi:hypothetical protein
VTGSQQPPLGWNGQWEVLRALKISLSQSAGSQHRLNDGDLDRVAAV